MNALVLFILMAVTVSAQNVSPAGDLASLVNKTNAQGMLVLGGWAAGNILASGSAWFATEGEAKQFHAMNTMWNIVNLGIAAFGFNSAVNYSGTGNPGEVIKLSTDMQNILLLNAGLDAAYIMTGFLLREKGKNSEKYKDILNGYGSSLILQGAFLLVFDTILYFVHKSNFTEILNNLNLSYSLATINIRIPLN